MINRDLLNRRVLPILCDPYTGQDLCPEGDAYVSTSARYPITSGVTRFVPHDQYTRSFSFEWNMHPQTQLDCFRDINASEHEFREKTAFSPTELRGRLILDAGVGAGRYAEVTSRWGADVVGVDLSYSVDAAHQSLGDRPNVWLAQADIGALPFKPASFDVIFSIGVLHHTPDTRKYFLKLVSHLKPGGTIAIWVYPKEDSYVLRKQWVRFVNKIPPDMFYAWCRWYVPWVRAHGGSPWVGVLQRAFPIPEHGRGMEEDILDTFDGYSPQFHWVHQPEEVAEWFREAGLSNIRRPSNWDTCMRGDKL